MKKLITLFAVCTLFIATSAVAPRPAANKEVAKEECIKAEKQISAYYTGQVTAIGSCTFGLKVCNTGNILLLDKRGYSVTLNQFYRVKVGGTTSCGGQVLSLTSDICYFP
ncbi:hypothetical protein AB9P05_11885 [Roseivirga sp. BDSF3-8]|uniref:hypothetical protein n=1 Tax=Roseivirga sp. BDSF3-8 TaxID=3241598 RepID=UPI003531EE2F